MSSAISIKNLSKEYRIKEGNRKVAFKALDNINLEIPKGQVTGLIGPNGAGKSTLLKILSHIIYPSSGRVDIEGRLASLLEVGTGFHPELTGRENIFLNGAILGMSRQEIRNHFDEIVEFSGVEKFLDTVVKHYSSGMYVRLAFSVAAHLQSEILLVDEVLAVGDAEFQKKCLDKMNEATHNQERTVVLVSHNMGIARSLCDSVIFLENGKIRKAGDTEEVTDFYLNSFRDTALKLPLTERKDRKGTGDIQFSDLRIIHPVSGRQGVLVSGESARFELSFSSQKLEKIADLNIQLNIFNEEESFLTTLSNRLVGKTLRNVPSQGSYACFIEQLPLMAGLYNIKAKLIVNGIPADVVMYAAEFEVLPGDYFNSGDFHMRSIPGVFIEQKWQ